MRLAIGVLAHVEGRLALLRTALEGVVILISRTCDTFGDSLLAGLRMSRWFQIFRYCLSEGVAKRSLGVALIVGTVLNLINQGDALLGSVPIHLPKLLLTFAVPYFVATYGAVSYRIRSERDRGPG